MIRKFWKTLLLTMLILCMSTATIPVFATEDVPTTLEIFIEEVVTVEDFETNAATLWIQEQLGCELDFIVAPTGSAEEKMNVLLNSGDYPDIFYRTIPNENLYGVESGLLLDLSDYVANSEVMPNLNHLMEIRPTLIPQLRAVNGALFTAPHYSECVHCQYSNKMFYNKGLLEAIGKEVPTTTDEMYDVMVAFKAAYPDGIPYAACIDAQSAPWAFLTNAWTYSTLSTGAAGNIGLRLHDDVVESMIDDEEYREALRYIKKLYVEDLLYEGSFTMDTNQLKALLASETPVLFWSATHNVKYVNAADTPELYANQKPLAPLMGPGGAQYTSYYPPAPTPGIAVSASCKNIDLAIRFIDLHYTAEAIWTINEGVRGVNWDWAEEGQKTMLGNPAIAYRIGEYIADIQNVKWEPRGVAVDIEEYQGRPFDADAYDESIAEWGSSFRSIMTNEFYAPYYQDEYQTIPAMKFTSEEEEELSMISVSLVNYIAQSRIGFITGTMDLDKDWDSYVSSLNNMGLQTAIDLYQTAYDRVK